MLHSFPFIVFHSLREAQTEAMNTMCIPSAAVAILRMSVAARPTRLRWCSGVTERDRKKLHRAEIFDDEVYTSHRQYHRTCLDLCPLAVKYSCIMVLQDLGQYVGVDYCRSRALGKGNCRVVCMSE